MTALPRAEWLSISRCVITAVITGHSHTNAELIFKDSCSYNRAINVIGNTWKHVFTSEISVFVCEKEESASAGLPLSLSFSLGDWIWIFKSRNLKGWMWMSNTQKLTYAWMKKNLHCWSFLWSWLYLLVLEKKGTYEPENGLKGEKEDGSENLRYVSRRQLLWFYPLDLVFGSFALFLKGGGDIKPRGRKPFSRPVADGGLRFDSRPDSTDG